MSCVFSNNNGAARCLPDYGMALNFTQPQKLHQMTRAEGKLIEGRTRRALPSV